MSYGPQALRPLIGKARAPALHVMTWNVRRAVPLGIRDAGRWRRRAPRLAALLAAERPTVLGVQEALPQQARFIRNALGGSFRYVGRGRAGDGRGEGCPIFYDSNRLELVNAQQLALSDRPNVAGSRSWGNVLPRIRLNATFRDRATGRSLFVVNTHLDHLSRHSRLRSAEAVRRSVAACGLPAIVTGDMNDDECGATIDELFRDDLLADAWSRAHVQLTPPWGTRPNYRRPRRNGRRIDWIAVSSGLRVSRAAVNAHRYIGGWGSDHLPVQVEIVSPE
ncbi:endonuclease/exonuclease/phosphatase family protein [Microbacterium sp. AK031]|uniref:endonuclease/exonuclease/phosphatase family protein n=1 Tax=Microbacterium sp. AK031 TaxID=2723076 RepID=UPI002169A2F9|nr:endonuclease/exonuclease/phosphatase family protein [Microbacterium sp. AK031]MCS3844520.1 endonuclease/exonuclease/phosphatase family metal-dependent hydrolase [Microbacterium sp. AK031]